MLIWCLGQQEARGADFRRLLPLHTLFRRDGRLDVGII
jgi:hypothetical protein